LLNVPGAPSTLSSDERQEITKAATAMAEGLPDSIKGAKWDFSRVTEDVGSEAVTTGNSISFFKTFFYHRIDVTTVGQANNNKVSYGDKTSVGERALSLIHEGLHLLGGVGFRDQDFGKILNNGKNVSKEKGSQLINDYVKEHCKKK
jgi:hypothetical protein